MQDCQIADNIQQEAQKKEDCSSNELDSSDTLQQNVVTPDSAQYRSVSGQSSKQPQSTISLGQTKLIKQPLKVFISYAHKDEVFKDELVIMLASLQRNGFVDTWQDRLIEPGDAWYQAIQNAMHECDLALLLVSKNFLASRFINDEEVPKLLERRQQEGMRLIPIIIRPCLWSSEPILRTLQALPKDGKAVITFPEDTGERDQAWTEIAKAIEKIAKEL
ncbi:toll/interleukin-1 receptor domain-containing protein [Adonisia turfae]|nr:toll/interleukin-1 receptor domain-containing protein [Adonisia turfae]